MGTGGNYWTAGIDPQNDWKEGLGVLLRVRWLALIAIVKAVGITTIWSYLGKELGTAAAIVGVSCYIGILVYRKWLIRQLQAGQSFHKTCHSVRDSLYHLQLLARQGKEVEYALEYARFHSEAANRIADFFRDSIGDSTIGCAIRLAQKIGQDAPNYVTVGRSDSLLPSRKDKTRPIPYDVGIPDMLRRKDHHGVCGISSIEDAIKDGWWIRSPTDELTDVRFLIIAPINSYKVSGEKKHMLGILYVTSAESMLKKAQIEPIKAFADLLGMVYLLVTGSFQKKTADEASHEGAIP
jgi:hypothetical protein